MKPIPNSAMIPQSAKQFTDALSDAIGANLVSVVLVGSFARGDQRPSSDVDLCVLVNEVDAELLRGVGKIVKSIETKNEINPAVVSLAELRAYPDLFEIHKLRHDGIVIRGTLSEEILPFETELTLAKRIAREVLMSARHYLAVAEPAENFMNGKLRPWILKPLSFALRYYHFHKTGSYLRQWAQLAKEYPVLGLDPIGCHQAVLEECIKVCGEILGAQKDGAVVGVS